jgi:hypothetical protein
MAAFSQRSRLPPEGCWEVLGTLATTSLRFVTVVIKQGA